VDNAHVAGDIDASVVAVEQLQHLALGDDVGGVGQRLHHAHLAHLHHHLERARIQEIAHQYAGRVAEQRVRSLAPAPQFGFVHHIVVQQGRGMDELHHRRQFMVALARITEGLRGEQHQRRTQALAAAVDDVGPDLVDQRHFGMQTGAYHRIHCLHIPREQLFELIQETSLFEIETAGWRLPRSN
jgi:hypothetical protein